MARIPVFTGAILAIAGLALLAYQAFGRDSSSGDSPITGLPGDPPQITATALPEATASPEATDQAQATASDTLADVVRIQIPAIEIDASVVTLGVSADGVMESPHTPADVGWYSFSAMPGVRGNAVFAGHVDYVNHGAAVFFRLNDLRAGDTVILTLITCAGAFDRDVLQYDKRLIVRAEAVAGQQE